MTRTLAVAPLVAATLLFTPPASAQDASTAPRVVNMGTGSVTGVYFPVGVALCRLVNLHRPETGLRCAARPSAGSVENIEGLRDGTFDLAMVQSDVQLDALKGTGDFSASGPFDGLAAMMALYPEPLTLVTRVDADIARAEDLAGKRVWLGAEGSGTRVLAQQLMAAFGWTSDSVVEVSDVSPDRLGPALCSGSIDAFLYAIGQPARVVREATTGCDARLVPIEGAAVAELVASQPSLVEVTIPGGLYRGNPDPTPTFGVRATLVAAPGLSDDTGYTIVRAIFDDFEMLRGLDPTLSDLDPQAMATETLSAPLQPGAARYYRERGWID